MVTVSLNGASCRLGFWGHCRTHPEGESPPQRPPLEISPNKKATGVYTAKKLGKVCWKDATESPGLPIEYAERGPSQQSYDLSVM